MRPPPPPLARQKILLNCDPNHRLAEIGNCGNDLLRTFVEDSRRVVIRGQKNGVRFNDGARTREIEKRSRVYLVRQTVYQGNLVSV